VKQQDIQKRTYVIVAIQLLLAVAFVLKPGSYLNHEGYIFYHSYFSDLAIPFSFYFLLIPSENKIIFLRGWVSKAAIILIAMTTSEIFQYFGIYFFGSTFDPLDIAAFALGTGMAVAFDLWIFPKLFSFWKTEY
jgi:hypothetical protein